MYDSLLKTEQARNLFSRLYCECGKDVYTFAANEELHANAVGAVTPYSLLCPPTFSGILSSGGKEEERHIATDSDYENFLKAVETLSDFSGSGYYAYVLGLLERYISRKPPLCEADAVHLWQRMQETVFGWNATLTKSSASVYRIESTAHFKNIRNEETLAAFEHSVRNGIASAKAVAFSLGDLDEFRSPNPYHAALAFEAVKSGKATNADRALLSSQLLRVAGETAQKQNIPIIFYSVRSSDSVSRAIAYLLRVERCPKCFFAVASQREFAEIKKSGALTQIERLILTVDDFSLSTADLCLFLSELAREYPIGRLSVIHGLRSCEAADALVREYSTVRFCAVLASLFTDWIKNGDLENEAAAMLGKRILCSNAETVCS